MRLQPIVVLIYLLMSCSIAAGSSHRRDQLQSSEPCTRRLARGPTRDPSSRNKDRTIFYFSSFGGAMSYLARLEPGKLSELMHTYGRDKGVRSLADQLDADPDFVSHPLQ